MTISLKIDGQCVTADVPVSLITLLRGRDIALPGLCAAERPGYEHAGSCRLCLVEVSGEAALIPACRTTAREGMVVNTSSPRLDRVRQIVGELTRSEHATRAPAAGALAEQLKQLGIGESRFQKADPPASKSAPHPAIRFVPDLCIRCGLCRTACQDVQMNGVIGMAGRGADSRIVFDLDANLAESSCVSCGECIQVCPTAAFSAAPAPEQFSVASSGETICPYCSVGCRVKLSCSMEGAIVASGADGPANHGRLCVKGRFGFEPIMHKDRLTTPLIRSKPKSATHNFASSTEAVAALFRPASWDEALDFAAAGLAAAKSAQGSDALAVLGSAKASNEDAYILQKLGRAILGTSHIDHCTRLCASVPPLAEAIGFAACTAPIEEAAHTDVILMVGSNPEVNHPVAATNLKNAIRAGAQLILVDPYQQPFARHALHHLQLRPGTDVTLLSAMLNVVISEKLFDAAFISGRVDGFPQIADSVASITPEIAGRITGVRAAQIRAAARLFATTKRAMTFWGMGASQHVHGADNIRCLVSLALICGHVGKPGSGLHPLRGQNNVQGSCDAGLIPSTLPGYQPLADPAARQVVSNVWGAEPPALPGLTVCEIIEAAYERKIRAIYVAGGNPAMANPDLSRTRESLSRLDFLVVQDIFPTETAVFADVIFPAAAIAERAGSYTNTDRLVQWTDPVLTAPGEARPDWWITGEIAKRMGATWPPASPDALFDEMASLVPVLRKLDAGMLRSKRSVRVPVASPPSLFADVFPTRNGRAQLTPVAVRSPGEVPDKEYPLVLVTGRLREHWHTGSMTRRSETLTALAPKALLQVAAKDFDNMLLREDSMVTVETRRGRVRASCVRDDRLQEGVVFLPFAFYEAAANELTAANLDPSTRVPEYKYCAARMIPLNATE